MFCALLLTPFISFPSLSAAMRGIRITDTSGGSLYLYKDYHALVVGVSNYEKWPVLPNATNDAKEVAAKLEEIGFEVTLIVAPTSQEMKTALNEMIYTTGKEVDRALLLYYAGHGETETLADETEMGYIIPKDCPLLKKDALGFAMSAISMRDIESASLRIKSKHALMLFDSCFSGSLFTLVRAVPDDITEKSTLPVRQYITTGRKDEQVPDRSMFKRCFLLGLGGDADLTGDGYITGSELGMYLSDKVVNYTRRRQHPQYGKINNPNLDRGDFIFASSGCETRLKAMVERLRKEIVEKRIVKEERNRLVKERKELLEAISQSEEEKETLLAEKRKLEQRIKQVQEEYQKSERLASREKQQLEEKLRDYEDTLRKLEDEVRELKADIKRASVEKENLQAKQAEEKQSAVHVPGKEKPGKEPTIELSPSITSQETWMRPVQNEETEGSESSSDKQKPLTLLNLPDERPEQDWSKLTITCNVKDAEVYIDTEEKKTWFFTNKSWIYRGRTPYSEEGIKLGVHEIKVSKEGYEEYRKTVHLNAGETIKLDVNLSMKLDGGPGGGGPGGGG